MKSIIPVILLSFLTIPSFSQGMYGFGIGVGYTNAYHSYITPAFEGYHLWKVTEHLYMGGDLALQRYSFLYDMPAATNIQYGDVVSIRQKASYLFLSPEIDIGIGYRKYIHVNISSGAGVIMSGKQWSNEYAPRLATAGGNIGADTAAINTSFNVPRVVYRAGAGISERIPTHRYFNIMLSQEFTYVASNLDKTFPEMHTSYFSFTVGIMHKYPVGWHETD